MARFQYSHHGLSLTRGFWEECGLSLNSAVDPNGMAAKVVGHYSQLKIGFFLEGLSSTLPWPP